MNDPIAELVARCDQEQKVTLGDIDRLSQSLSMTREQFYDAVMLFVAGAFLRGELSFGTADAVANTLWSVSGFCLPSRAYDLFLAFDEGEYYHAKDPHGSDPIALYTRPQIQAVLRQE